MRWPPLVSCLLALGLPLLWGLRTPVCAAPPGVGSARLVAYVSPLDGSQQEYGIYLPAREAPAAAGYPAVFHMHGYGWSVSAGFSDYQKQWADARGWILINLNARGPQFYEGVGDVESRNVVQDAHRRFGLDLDRLYAIGSSMGGTGAFRLGVRYPDIFAAVVGVDGWSDFREWHYHWYARTDQREAIEEFRRPLLEACSPLYWVGRARWGAVQASVSGKDTVVLPDNGLLLYNALLAGSDSLPGTHDNRLFLDPEAGHGGSFRMDQAYEFFASRSRTVAPPSFRLESTLLVHGAGYWGSMDRFHVQGLRGALESDCQGEVLSAVTENLDAFSLYLTASPLADRPQVRVYADGFLCYEGEPTTVPLVAERGPQGQLWGWRQGEAPTGRRKTRTLEGPLGEAFKVPFVVVYGTAGQPQETARHRREAEDFARGWNAFMVHGEGLTARPEEQLAPADLEGKSLVVYGTEASSRLLREANTRRELPVRVGRDSLIVRDPDGDRVYAGDQYGAFVCIPNPLTEGRTYLVICSGQWATQPAGQARQGLEYDLEKLPWAYPDYVIFNTDPDQLPLVPNVNNKPPVTCYEAGYFVEAGWLDQDWQPDRGVTLERVLRAGLPTRRMRVEELTYSPLDEAPALCCQVVDQTGAPVAQARVTAQLHAAPRRVCSGVTDGEGWVRFQVSEPQRTQALPASVVNVEATGGVYDWRQDAVACPRHRGLGLRLGSSDVSEGGLARLTVEVTNRAWQTREIALRPTGQTVSLSPAAMTLTVPARGTAAASFTADLSAMSPGTYPALVVARTEQPEALTVSRTFPLRVPAWSPSSVRLLEVKGTDIEPGEPYQITARLVNTATDRARTIAVAAALITARRYLTPQSLTLEPAAEATVTFKADPAEEFLARGVHLVRITVPGETGVTATTEFNVR